MTAPACGAYVTMITPYNQDGTVDFGAAETSVDWYWNRGCDGIFAVCQSIISNRYERKIGDRLETTLKQNMSSIHAESEGDANSVIVC